MDYLLAFVLGCTLGFIVLRYWLVFKHYRILSKHIKSTQDRTQ
jgi:hypothetical protein